MRSIVAKPTEEHLSEGRGLQGLKINRYVEFIQNAKGPTTWLGVFEGYSLSSIRVREKRGCSASLEMLMG